VLLVQAGNLDEANALFFDAREEGVHEAIVQRAGMYLMDTYNRYSRHAEAPAIFQHLSLYPPFVGTRGLNLCLEAYLIRKDYVQFISTFKHYTGMQIVKPDHKTYELFIKCLVKVGDISEARDVMKRLEDQRKPVTESAFAAFLAGVRDKTASFTELEQDFEWIRSRKRIVAPALYNVMIEEALAYGKPQLARQYVDKMIQDGVKPDDRTFATFLLMQAGSGDWEGVRKAMKEVTRKGMQFSRRTLNSLLDTYVDIEGVDGLEDFFDMLSNEPRFPSPASFNIMIRAHLQAVDEAGVMRWVGRMRDHGVEPNATTFNTFLHDLRCTNVPRSLMYRVYYTVFHMDRNKVDEISRDILRRSVFPVEKKIEPPPPQHAVTPEVAMQSADVIKHLRTALQYGRVRETLNIFREASAHVAVSREVIGLLARAYVLLPDDLLDLPSVLPRDRDRAALIRESVAGYMIDLVKEEADKHPVVYTSILQLIYGLYKFMEGNDLSISHNIRNQAAAILTSRQDMVGALHIMNEVSKTRWGRRTGWDLAGLTALLHAYCLIYDRRGMHWVVSRLLESREVSDDRFQFHLSTAAKTSGSHEFREEALQLLERCRDDRGKRWGALKRRASTVVNVMDPNQSPRNLQQQMDQQQYSAPQQPPLPTTATPIDGYAWGDDGDWIDGGASEDYTTPPAVAATPPPATTATTATTTTTTEKTHQ